MMDFMSEQGGVDIVYSCHPRGARSAAPTRQSGAGGEIQFSSSGALDKIHQLRGVSYDWRWGEFSHIKRYRVKPHAIGVIAPLIEAVKELDNKQEEQMAALKAENAELKAKLASLETDSAEMHAMMGEVLRDVKGLKTHTGYGINKAEIGIWFIAGMAGSFGCMALFMFFFGNKFGYGILRTHQKHHMD